MGSHKVTGLVHSFLRLTNLSPVEIVCILYFCQNKKTRSYIIGITIFYVVFFLFFLKKIINKIYNSRVFAQH